MPRGVNKIYIRNRAQKVRSMQLYYTGSASLVGGTEIPRTRVAVAASSAVAVDRCVNDGSRPDNEAEVTRVLSFKVLADSPGSVITGSFADNFHNSGPACDKVLVRTYRSPRIRP